MEYGVICYQLDNDFHEDLDGLLNTWWSQMDIIINFEVDVFLILVVLLKHD